MWFGYKVSLYDTALDFLSNVIFLLYLSSNQTLNHTLYTTDFKGQNFKKNLP